MLNRYKEIFFGLLLGLTMWAADALMHTRLSAGQPEQPTLLEEMFRPEGPPFFIRALYAGFALFLGWLLWRSNRRERALQEWEQRIKSFQGRVVDPVRLLSTSANTLLCSDALTEPSLAAIHRIRNHILQLEDFAKHFPPHLPAGTGEPLLNWEVKPKAVAWWQRLKAVPVVPGLTSISLVVAVGFALRFGTVMVVYDQQLTSSRGDFEFGWEAGRIARSLASGQGFSSPLWGETGPTAWLAPVYPLLLASVFTTFGIYTEASAIVILSVQSLFSSLTAIPLVLSARKIFGDKVAVWTGWAWAFFPYAIFINAFRVWGEGLDAFLVAWILWFALRLATSSRSSLWFSGGLLVGVAALTNPNTLSLIPGLGGWACYCLRAKGAPWRKPLLLAVLALLAVVAPWFVRNYQTFAQFLPFRSNFWLEVQLGNNQQAIWRMTGEGHPASDDNEFAAYQQLGELQYMAQKRRQSIAFIKANPGTFLKLTVRRMLFVWTGFWSLDQRYLALEPLQIPFIFFSTTLSLLMALGLYTVGRSAPAYFIPLGLMILCQPLVYYVTHPAIEYRHAIDPIIVLLAAGGIRRLKVR